MAPSQLKQLKASLHENRILGPQQSKKQKRANAKSGANRQNRIQRNAALQGIRERFNPFEIKAPVKSVKFGVATSSKAIRDRDYVRPGVTKSLGEERRRATLLKELHSRSKVGGILDRRFGENDPTMTPEEKAAERFARESQKRFRKEALFNLEDEEEDIQLTHMGQSISFGGDTNDDFREDDISGSDDDMFQNTQSSERKRSFIDEGGMGGVGDEDEEEHPERKKTKAEVMKELIAKSKFYKHERQKAKEDDEDLRAELDKELPSLFEVVQGASLPVKQGPLLGDSEKVEIPDNARKDSKAADREYDQRLKQMTFEKRSKPTDRIKTEEEKAEEEAERLKTLEMARLRRMRGEEGNLEDEEVRANQSDSELMPDDAKVFGLSQPSNIHLELGAEDEDDFVIDESLVETDSDASLSFIQNDWGEISEARSESEEEEDQMMNGLTFPVDGTREVLSAPTRGFESENGNLAFTYICPETHQHFLDIIKKIQTEDLPAVIQRIRALHHPRLHSDNKWKLARFSAVLVEHVSYMANQSERPSFTILENILRHIHSLAKNYPENVATAFRAHLRCIATERPLKFLPGDLVILTGVLTIFPTSDHFHTVTTPANLCLARYLGQSTIDSLTDLAIGAYIANLCIQYQVLAKRFIPEFMNYCLNALHMLCPVEIKEVHGFLPLRKPTRSLRLHCLKHTTYRRIQFWDILETELSPSSAEELKLSLICMFISLIDFAADLWSTKSAFKEMFDAAHNTLLRLSNSYREDISPHLQNQTKACVIKLERLFSQARTSRRPLALHNHRPLAIKTFVPKFEENFNPDRHYDPNQERAELNRLKAEHKRERKGAMRELRKDANFIAREALKEKKERDVAYEKKFKRIIADIQGEEGREANSYKREQKKRQGIR
ncbi:hypothetical protein Egran_02918 [Elaphomyces granulatus]|uniref:Nop14-like family protein n=1 Tax=Elaphomyces granulatus TaxID=519963 RepID=A0A232LYX9_9EURO|nr:hypothetical protein Egran_02918 [Elaphomyces granulatus]